jgi:hypothetical protein
VIALNRSLAALWPEIDLQNLRGTLPRYKLSLIAAIRQAGLASAALSRREYERQRVQAGIRSQFSLPAPNLPTVEQIDKKLNWAVADLWGPEAFTDPKVVETAQNNVEGGATKLVLDVGRELVIDAVSQDRQARAWARETRPGCCYFCAMLAGRGAVYKTARSAGQGNEFHNHDRCVVVPVFGEYEPSAHARQWAAEWRSATRGLSGADAVLAWRQHFEGRASN